MTADDGWFHVFLSDLEVVQSRVPLRVMLYLHGIIGLMPFTQIDHHLCHAHEFVQAYPHTIHQKPPPPLL